MATDRLDRRVAAEAGVSRSTAHDLVVGGSVRVDGREERRPSFKVTADAVLEVDHDPVVATDPVADPGVVVPVVHADEHLFVVDKPAGLVVHPGAGTGAEPTLVHGLLALDPAIAGVGPDPGRPGIVHRLDRGTSGLMLVARTDAAHRALTEMIAEHRVTREYRALVAGTVPEEAGRVEAPLGRDPRRPTLRAVAADGKAATTSYRVEARYAEPEPLTLLRVRLAEGRTHQIRVHLAAIGHPVVGDRAYGDRSAVGARRPFLHSAHLELDHPVTGEHLALEADLPPDLSDLLAGLA